MSQLVGYARVSTREQNTALQLDALKEAGCERVFEDQISGTKAERPGLAQALDYLRAGDTLVVWRLDRLARSMKQLIETVTLLHSRNIELRSLHESIDTTSPTGRLTFHLFASLSEFERDLVSTRTKAGLDAARARGRKGGRPRKLTPDDVKAAGALLKGGLPFADVARRMNVKPQTLYNYFPADQRPAYSAELGFSA